MFALVFLLLWALHAAPSLAAEPGASIELRQARFQPGESAAEHVVNLPDTWSLRGLPPQGQGRYRLQLNLSQAPTQMWALRADRISSTHAVYVNDRLVHVGSTPTPGTGRPMAQLINLPPSVLRAGANEIRIEVDYRYRGGLSTLALGPYPQLQPDFALFIALSQTLPESLNLAGAAFALFMLVIWWRRRSEAAIGWFGALCMLVSVRNFAYFVVDGPSLPTGLSSWLFYMAQVATVLLFGKFAQAFSGRRRRGFDLVLNGTAIVLPLAWLLGSTLAEAWAQQGLRAITYPLLIALSLPSLWFVFVHIRQTRPRGAIVLLLGLCIVLVGGVHDYLYQQGHLSVLGAYWMPYATPLALLSFALVLVNRLVQALSEVALVNASLERRVAERTRELELAGAAKTRFLAAASHDLRQPVVAISLLVGLVREQVATLPPVRAMLDRVHAAVASMEVLLNGLMDLSRLESGDLKPSLQAVPLAPLFDAIDLHAQSAAASKGLRLHFRVRGLVVTSDPVLLGQIVRNLVDNALRYTERGGVLVSARRRGLDTLLLQVWDTGRGIAEDAQARVFEEFVQLDNPGRDRRKGLGLGLAIVQRGARLLGARLSLRSVPGRGSCFTLELPLALSEPATNGPAPLPELPLRGVSVWLIEDDAAVRGALCDRLRRWGARVAPLSGRADVQRQLDTAAALPTLVVSDQRLPDGSGLDCVALIRLHAGRAVPAVIVTGDTAPADLALLAGADLPVLHKPFSADALLALLQQALVATPAGR